MSKPNTEMTNKRGRVINAASDGACSGNPGPGGWGALIRFEDGTVEEFGGYEQETTNNRMELKAVLEIFKHLKNLPLHPNLTIRTDSKYLINGLNNWIKGWKRNGWRTASGKPVLNQDLWQSLDDARLTNVALEFVKGHSGDPDNDRVDQIAVQYSKGAYIDLNPKQISNTTKKIITSSLDKTSTPKDSVSKGFQKLISRLDIANHIATHGYGLSTEELAELLEAPTNELKTKQDPWQWRDWLVEPIGDSRWRLKALKQNQTCYEEGQDAKNK